VWPLVRFVLTSQFCIVHLLILYLVRAVNQVS
jgi:hypothetical protein